MIDTLPGRGSARVLVIVAHPDDETFGTGSLLLHLADAGASTIVCCATRGEAGDVRDGVIIPEGGVARLREQELRGAAAMLGVRSVRLLDFLDSGMSGSAPPGSLMATDPTIIAQRLSAVVADVNPHAIVTLDGSDGHRDHLRMREVTEDVGHKFGVPVWLHCLPRRLMRRWAEQLAGQDPHSPYLTLGELGTPEESITARIDTERHYSRRKEAIALHASQTSPFENLPPNLHREFLTTENLIGPLMRHSLV